MFNNFLISRTLSYLLYVTALWRDFRFHSLSFFSIQCCFVLFLFVVVLWSCHSSSLPLSLSFSPCLCSRLLSLCSLLRFLVLLSCLLLSLNNTLWYFSLPSLALHHSTCPSVNFPFLFPRFIKEAISWRAWKKFFCRFEIKVLYIRFMHTIVNKSLIIYFFKFIFTF